MRISIFFLISFLCQQIGAQTTIERPTLLVFSGSDWCIPCIQLEKTILTDSLFLAYVDQHLDFVNADFPQRKQISKAQQKQNEALADRYNPEGYFPKIVLLHPDRTVWAVLPWRDHSPESFTKQIDAYLSPN